LIMIAHGTGFRNNALRRRLLKDKGECPRKA
jgi:hypothetical protein